MDMPYERLKQSRIAAGYKSAAAAARAFGWKDITYRHHENGTRNFDMDHAVSYAKAYRVRPAWLAGIENHLDLAGRSNLRTLSLLDSESKSLDGKHINEELEKEFGVSLVRHIPAGHEPDPSSYGTVVSGETYVGFPKRMLEDLAKSSPYHIFSWEVSGNAMAPTIREGAHVLIDSGHAVIDQQDEIWLCRLYCDNYVIRRVQRRPPDLLVLTADGPNVEPMTVMPDDLDDLHVIIIGKVVWIGQAG